MKRIGLVLAIVFSVSFCVNAVFGQESAPQPPQMASGPQLPDDPNHVVLVLDGKDITLGQLKYLNPNLDYASVEQMVKFLIDNQLLYDEAVKRGLDKDAQTKFIADISYKKVFAGKLMEKVVAEAEVNDIQVKKYYDENKDTDQGLQEPMYLSFSHIALESSEDAEKVLKRLQKGEDINELAKTLSKANDAKNGGRALKYQERTVEARYGKEFLDALLAAEEGQLIGPIANKKGQYEVARHEGKKMPMTKDFESVREQIKAKLQRDGKRKTADDFLENMRESAKSRYKKTGILSEDKKDENAVTDEKKDKKKPESKDN